MENSTENNPDPTPLNITAKSDPGDIRIYINDLLHIYLVREKIIGFQSWYITKWCYKIEIYTTDRDILLEYSSPEKWKLILELLNKHL